MFERIQACNKINKLANKHKMCYRKFVGKMIWHRNCRQYFVVEGFCVCLSLDYFIFVCVFSSLCLIISLSNVLSIYLVPYLSLKLFFFFFLFHNLVICQWNYLFISPFIYGKRIWKNDTLLTLSFKLFFYKYFSIYMEEKKGNLCALLFLSFFLSQFRRIMQCNHNVFFELHIIIFSFFFVVV